MLDKVFLNIDGIEYTYKRLFDDINQIQENNYFVFKKNNHLYDIYCHIIHSVINDYDIELINGNLTNFELEELGINVQEIIFTKSNEKDTKITLTETIDFTHYINNSKKWRVALYTSGTTGKPKKIIHSLQSITRNLITNDARKADVWYLSYHPTHIAGLLVFFQALINYNTIVYSTNSQEIGHYIDKYQITHLSGTPTFYRNIWPYIKENTYSNVKNITMGGEQFDNKLKEKLHKIFPNAKFKNTYSTTEIGSLLDSDGEFFFIKEKLKPFIKVSETGELNIHQSLIGNVNNFDDFWYSTGDIVEFVAEDTLKIVGRNISIINVGGYRVNPLELEQVILELPFVLDVLVKSKNNSITGNIMVADIVVSDSLFSNDIKQQIKTHIKQKLQSWKVPRIINIVDSLEKTYTGKKRR